MAIKGKKSPSTPKKQEMTKIPNNLLNEILSLNPVRSEFIGFNNVQLSSKVFMDIQILFTNLDILTRPKLANMKRAIRE